MKVPVTGREPDTSSVLRGAIWGTAAAVIAAGWWVATRLSVSHSLDHYDLAALRFGVAGLLLAPVLLRHWGAIRRVPWPVLAMLAIGAGAPYAVIAGGGVRFTPAGNGGALVTGLLPVFAALLSAVVVKEPVESGRRLGLGIIVAGTLAICGHGMLTGANSSGYLLLGAGALLWAGFTVALRRSGLAAIQAVAVLSVASLVLYLPVYALWLEPGIPRAPSGELLLQATYQGVVVGCVAMYCYGRAVALLGPARSAALLALVPVLATVLGMLVLDEHPGPAEAIGVLLVSAGVGLASGVRLSNPITPFVRRFLPAPRYAGGFEAPRAT